jgi:hypothetical protein
MDTTVMTGLALQAAARQAPDADLGALAKEMQGCRSSSRLAIRPLEQSDRNKPVDRGPYSRASQEK